MKKTMLLILASVLVATFYLTACDRENEKENEREYPVTADVIRNAVKDIDGNKYDAVRIGDQVWMAENLKTTRFADGTEIPLGGEASYSEEQPLLYYPFYSANLVKNFGYLYNWSAMIHGAGSSNANPSGVQGICPNGWHVPSDTEWTQLMDYLKSQPMYVHQVAKSLASTKGWTYSENENAVGNDVSTNNATGFSAVPTGWGHHGYVGDGFSASFWSVTLDSAGKAQGFYMHTDNSDVTRIRGDKHAAFSVRCLRD
ncbi:MAG: fibrobacter succinogenes major paralogous domain-containing protein [Bacteroidales bacterium]|nr:fibrobacter succinogenes major paralogous domain-containing protein [Bacteroidales bacterium]